MKHLLIDGDQFLFKACIAVEQEIRWDEQNHVLFSNENKAWDNLTGMLKRIFERFETNLHTLCFSQAPNFRHDIDPTYKGNRTNTRKPLCYALLREKLEEGYECKAFAGLEADDVMGILATAPKKRNVDHIIVSHDKDMKTIPTTLWDGEDLTTYSEAQADYWHLYQTLIGDTSDGYKGCPGVGPKKAEAILSSEVRDDEVPFGRPPVTWWKRIVATYVKAELTEEDAIQQARLARILRWSDWDNKKKQPILWTPPTA